MLAPAVVDEGLDELATPDEGLDDEPQAAIGRVTGAGSPMAGPSWQAWWTFRAWELPRWPVGGVAARADL